VTTAAAALAEGTARLRACSDAPRIDALTLLEATLRKPRGWIAAFGEHPLSADDAVAFQMLCERRASGVPTAYLLERAGSYGHEFLVDERVLVPRPESEHLVDEAVAFLSDREADVLDVGTGSGALACSIAAATRATVYATDISHEAVAVANENVRRLRLEQRCHVAQGDLLEPFAGRRFDVVVANLPYVPTGDVPQSPDPVSFEPRIAVDGGADGLHVYRRLLRSLPAGLNSKALIVLEAAPPSITALRQLVRDWMPEATVEVGRDYAGLERYVKASLQLPGSVQVPSEK
jgi:release factor glutamine methyltransferase